MESLINLVSINLAKVGIGAVLFMITYLSNMGLGAWRSVKIDGATFNWELILDSLVKYVVLILSGAGLCIAVTLIPEYANYVGFNIPEEYIEVVSNVVIIGVFITGALVYIKDAVDKLKEIVIG